MRWTNAYSACPVCSPTRAALLTGKSTAKVHFTGHITAIGRHRYPEKGRIIPPDDLMYLPHEEILIPEALKSSGYKSISIGKWHVGHEGYYPTDQGFDINIGGWTHGSPPSHFFPYKDANKDWNPSIPTLQGGADGEYLTDRLTDEAIKFIEENRENPFLVYLTHYAVHTPLEAPEELVEKYQSILKGTKIDPVYAAMVESVDSNIGRLLQRIDNLKLDKNTVVIFASDNGAVDKTSDNAPFRKGKGHLYEGGIRVPFIMRWPGKIKEGTISDNPTISQDIFPTIVDIIGPKAQMGTLFDGRSLVPDFNENNKINTDLSSP
jgi:arylsulfatase A-like enzyme